MRRVLRDSQQHGRRGLLDQRGDHLCLHVGIDAANLLQQRVGLLLVVFDQRRSLEDRQGVVDRQVPVLPLPAVGR